MKRLIKRSHFDNVDALRFLAFMAIFISNCFVTNNQELKASTLFGDLKQFSGNLAGAAYSFLFILTGFLNTWTVFEERFIYKHINLLRYYMRRVLTIIPLYLLIVAIAFYVLPQVNTGLETDPPAQGAPLWAYLTFTQNFWTVPVDSPVDLVSSNLWSIAVYMQFVILWPVLMNIFRRNETVLFALVLLVFAGSAWMMSGDESYRYSSLNILCEFVTGAYIAYFSFFKYPLYTWFKKNTRRTIGFIYLVFFIYMVFRERILHLIPETVPDQAIFLAERLLLCAALGFFLFEQNFNSNSVLKASKLKIFNAPGERVYGLYMFHAIGVIIGYQILVFLVDQQKGWSVFILEPFLCLVATAVLALFSYEYFERKFLRRRKNYQPSREYNPMGLSDVKTKSS